MNEEFLFTVWCRDADTVFSYQISKLHEATVDHAIYIQREKRMNP